MLHPLKGHDMRDNTKRKLQWKKKKMMKNAGFTFDSCEFFGVKNDLGQYFHGFDDEGRVAHFSDMFWDGSLTRELVQAEAMAKHLDEMIEGRTHEVHGTAEGGSTGNFPNADQLHPRHRVRPSAFAM